MTATDRPVLEWNTTVKTVLVAAALLAPAALVVTSPANAFVPGSLHTTTTIDKSVTTFPHTGRTITVNVNLVDANGNVPENAYMYCTGIREEGQFATLRDSAPVDPVTGNAAMPFETPAAGHYDWTCGWGPSYRRSIYQGSEDSVVFTITEVRGG